MGFFDKFKNNKNNEKDIIMENYNFGDLLFKQDKKGGVICEESKNLFEKYATSIKIKNYLEKDNELYKTTFEYIHIQRKKIEDNLKKFYLDRYDSDSVEDGFKMPHIDSSTYADLVSVINETQDIGSDLIGIDELKQLIDNSNEDDIFFEITAEFYESSQLVEEYAIAYINCRTKEICYCFDIF